MKKFLIAAALVAFVAPAAQARGMKPGKFVDQAAISNMFEIQSSQVALEKSTRDDVKRFAQHMIDDHTKVSNEMTQLLQSSNMNVQPPADLDKKHAQQVMKMQGLTGAKFDTAYINAQVKGHQDAVKLFQSYAQNGDNAQLKQFAQATLPTLQEHLREAQGLKSGAKTSMR